MLKISDEDELKKQNITIEDSKKEIDANIEKLNKLKNSIEKEMIQIDKAYEKVDKEITKSYELKREKLKNEVTKIKEKFEISLSEITNILKMSEKIIKGIKSLEKEEKTMIQTLSYISKINKNQKKMRNLFSQLMNNLKLSFIEEESNIKYEEYYFNGLPVPKDIEIKDIENDSFKISWKIEDNKILHLDKNKIKFRLLLKKVNTKDDYNQIYEGKENNYTVNKLERNTNYEFKICSVYDDLISECSKLKQVKTYELESKILNESGKGKEFLEKIYEWTGYKKVELLYRGTRDGSGADIFHNKCDNKGQFICLCKNEKENIFGAYSSTSWTSDNNYHSMYDSFLFTLTNIYNTNPTKFPISANQNNAAYHYYNYGPTFGGNHDLYISSNYLNNNSSYASLGNTYSDVLGRGNSIFSGDNNTNNFKLKELEVLKITN